MTSGTVSVRLSAELLRQLEKQSQERHMKVSDLVREFIRDGLASGGSIKQSSAVVDQLTGIRDILSTIVHEAVGARYFSEVALSYAVDMESLIRKAGFRQRSQSKLDVTVRPGREKM